MLCGGLIGAAAGFVLGLIVGLSLLTMITFFGFWLVFREMAGCRWFYLGDLGCLACPLAILVLLILGLMMIPYAWLRMRPLPAQPLAWIARGVALLFFGYFCKRWVELAGRMDEGHAMLYVLIAFSLVGLGSQLAGEAKARKAAVGAGEKNGNDGKNSNHGNVMGIQGDTREGA